MTSDAPATVFAGIWRFTLVSVAGFAPWVLAGPWFYRTVGEAGLYLACLVAFLLSALLLLPGLLAGERRLRRTAMWFLPAFTAYAVLWCACWFALGGRAGEWAGAVTGVAAFVALSAWTLGRPRAPLITAAVVIAAHAAGYFAGDQAYRGFSGQSKTLGMLAWGVCYGVGFGAGLGWLIRCSGDGRSPAPAIDQSHHA